MTSVGLASNRLATAVVVCLCVLAGTAALGSADPGSDASREGSLENSAKQPIIFPSSSPAFDGLSRWFNITGLATIGVYDRPVTELGSRLDFPTTLLGRVGVDLWADAKTVNYQDAPRAHRLGSGARFRLRNGYGEGWVGGSGGAAWDGANWNGFGWIGGGWGIRARGLSASLAVANNRCAQEYTRISYVRVGDGIDSLGATLKRVDERGRGTLSYTDTQMSVGWTHGRVEFGVVGGLRLFGSASTESRSWLQIRNSYSFSDRFALSLEGGRRPASLEMGIPEGNFVAIAAEVRFLGNGDRPTPGTSGRSDWGSPVNAEPLLSMTKLGHGICRITMVIPGARTVLISGDFSNWQPLSMSEVAPDTWQIEITAAPGEYRISISIDGGPWQAPPGLTSQDDEFGQTTGILLVR